MYLWHWSSYPRDIIKENHRKSTSYSFYLGCSFLLSWHSPPTLPLFIFKFLCRSHPILFHHIVIHVLLLSTFLRSSTLEKEMHTPSIPCFSEWLAFTLNQTETKNFSEWKFSKYPANHSINQCFSEWNLQLYWFSIFYFENFQLPTLTQCSKLPSATEPRKGQGEANWCEWLQ